MAAGATVILSGVTPTPTTTTDTQGSYNFLVAPATYGIDVAFSGAAFSSQGRTVASRFALMQSTQRDLVVPVISLRGRVVDDQGALVPNVAFHAQAVAQNVCCGGFDVVNLTSAADGGFFAKVLAGNYSQLQLTPPPGTAYVQTSLPNASWTGDVGQDFVIQRNHTVTGVARLDDGTILSGATVVARVSTGGQTAVTADGLGRYRVNLAAGTYAIEVAFSIPGFSTQARTVANQVAIAADTVLDLVVPTIHLAGRAVDDQGIVVPNVAFHALAFAQNACCGGFDNVNLTSGADGSFSARILAGSYFQIGLTPPSGTVYVQTTFPNASWTSDVVQDFIIQRNRVLSGVVRFADGSAAAGATVVASNSSSTAFTATADQQGRYTLNLAPGTYSVDVAFSNTGFATQGRTVASGVPLSQDMTLDLSVPTVVWSGFVTDGSGTPLAGVTLSGSAFAHGTPGGFDNVRVVTGADGRFSATVLPNTYSQVHLTPAVGTPFVDTPLSNQVISGPTMQTYILVGQP